jgi:hypothetical protein
MHKKKGRVILRILAQESLDLELWLKRYGWKNFWGGKLAFWKVPGVYFKNCRGSGELRVKFGESGGFICKTKGLGLIYMKNLKTRGLGVKFAKDIGPRVDIHGW